MKKSLLVLAICLSLSSAFADGEKTAKTKIEKEPISKGFYLHLGLGFPAYKPSYLGIVGPTKSLGPQGNIEIGNQWYFVKNDKFGVGIKVSWLQFGYGQTTEAGYSSKTATLDFRFLKIAPQFSLALGDKSALDIYIEVAPTVMLTGNTEPSKEFAILNTGVLFAPGLRLRYGKFAIGADVSLGRLATNYTDKSASNTTVSNLGTYKSKSTFVIPRIYIGFKF